MRIVIISVEYLELSNYLIIFDCHDHSRKKSSYQACRHE